MRGASLTFRLSSLLAWSAFLAVAFGVATTGSPSWGFALQLAFLLSLGWAIIMTLALDGHRRVFWTGYLIFSVLYVAAVRNEMGWLGIEGRELPSSRLIEACVERLHPRVETGGGWAFPEEGKVAYQAMQRAFAIVFGFIAGMVTRIAYRRHRDGS